ncbi:aminoglycoside phosphotransferase family protein [Nocardia sp. CA2R105]|uniref:aminoglycoside phosphotransferase family protein n=1 Tax=Nocardia coffeae TaxID=2873381 RepID=UPI001CA7309E|nr:aminoglycoside phosphotransferase family protein [Nocardia coffeae]MBY8862615.1 aminoglycoside phosphotransferase family protein [Nocardia coffeae]
MITTFEPAEPVAAPAFTPERTLSILEHACRAVGLDHAGAQLMRHHTNAVYRLVSAPVVVKIDRPCQGRSPVDVVALVRWLQARQVPVVGLAPARQPMKIGGSAITFWRYLPQFREIAAPDLAAPLSMLHSLRTRPPQWLPARHLAGTFTRIAQSIAASRILTPEDRALLRAERARLAARAAEISFVLPPGLIHGDAHHRNMLWDPATGGGVLCDWESAAYGHPEWDLVTLEVHCRRFAHPAAEYEKFCHAYGFDIRTWPGYSWLRDLRELRMITTNAYKSAPDTPCAREVLRRIAALRAGVPSRWNIL